MGILGLEQGTILETIETFVEPAQSCPVVRVRVTVGIRVKARGRDYIMAKVNVGRALS